MGRDVVDGTPSLSELLDRRAAEHPDRVAFVFLPDRGPEQSLSYGELQLRARKVASGLYAAGAHGRRVLLMYPTGLEFIVAFFGCQYAAATAVPVAPGRPVRGGSAAKWIAADCAPCLGLTTHRLRERLRQNQPSLALEWQTIDSLSDSQDSGHQSAHDAGQLAGRDVPALLQYTSGSTTQPRGVMVSHANLLSNLALIRYGFQLNEASTGVFCLPLYHDMGLVGTVLEPIYVGGTAVLMSPLSLVRSPLRWLRTIGERRAQITGAPDFAFGLCVDAAASSQTLDVDLRSLRLAFCGAEPVRWQTLSAFEERFESAGFSAEAWYPCYGLAEATLMVSGGLGPAIPTTCTLRRTDLETNRVVFDPSAECGQTLVGCGTALLDTQLAIVSPEQFTRCTPDQIGEIWVRGPGVALGYWNQPAATLEIFRAHVADTGDNPFLRTGDLGFMHDGRLFIVGRLSDRIVLRGRNLYPEDIELAVEQSHPGVRAGGVAAFSVDVGDVPHLVVTCELERTAPSSGERDVARAVRRTIFDVFGVESHAVLMFDTGRLPRTTSGKIRRAACRELYLEHCIELPT